MTVAILYYYLSRYSIPITVCTFVIVIPCLQLNCVVMSYTQTKSNAAYLTSKGEPLY